MQGVDLKDPTRFIHVIATVLTTIGLGSWAKSLIRGHGENLKEHSSFIKASILDRLDISAFYNCYVIPSSSRI